MYNLQLHCTAARLLNMAKTSVGVYDVKKPAYYSLLVIEISFLSILSVYNIRF